MRLGDGRTYAAGVERSSEPISLPGTVLRYVLISDVHANLPALEAVLADIPERDDLTTVHLGDLVGYAPWPNEVVELLDARGITGVAGNYDSTVATDYAHCGCKYEDEEQERLSHVSYDWTRRHVTPETKQRLGELPFRLDVRPRGGHAGGPKLILVHGTPTLNTLYWTEDRPDDFFRQMANVAGMTSGDVIAYGHTHKPYLKVVDEVTFVNTGSVGKPKDGDWRAGYVSIDFVDDTPDIDFRRVEYDVDRAVGATVDAGLPERFGELLRSGGV